MKQVKLLCIAVVTIMISACNNDDKKVEVITIDNVTYTGIVTVDQNDGTFYTQENVNVVLDAGTDKVEIKMLQVSFSEKMPVSLDMTIPGIAKTEVIDGILLSGDIIIPLAMGGEFPRYTITKMSGKATLEALTFSLVCGEYPFSFSGILKEE